MSLLIMVLVIGIGAGISFVLNTRIRVIQFSSHGVAAQYVSESAAELTLMQLTQSRFDRNSYDDTALALALIESPAFQYGGSVKSVTVDKTVASYKTHLRKDESVTLDLIERDDQGLDFTLGALNLAWDSIDGLEKLEVSWTGLDTSGGTVSGRTYLTTSNSGGVDVDFSGTSTDRGYRVTIKSLFSGVNNLTMKPKKVGGAGAPNIDPAFAVKVTGEFGKSQWTKQYVAPWRAPSTPLLQYVIFSDDVLSKPVIP